MTYSVLEYLYRDAGNNKAWGEVLLEGVITDDELSLLRRNLDSGEYFIPEEFGIPSLQAELWQRCNTHYSDELDHPWHELVELRPATSGEESRLQLWGSTNRLLEKLKRSI